MALLLVKQGHFTGCFPLRASYAKGRQGATGQPKAGANTCKRKAQIGLLASLLGIRFLIPNFKNPFALKRYSTLTPFPTYYIPTVHDFKALVEGRVGGEHCC